MIRTGLPADYDALGAVMFTSIHSTPSPYTEAQRKAWNSTPPQGANWQSKLAAQFVVLAETNADLTGFMTLRRDGYLDFAYILPSARGTGVFRALYTALEAQAKSRGLRRIWLNASLMAQAPFAAMGFQVVQHETVTRNGETLARAQMEKHL